MVLSDSTTRQRLFQWLRATLLRVDPSLTEDQIVEHASLIYDLGLDSLRLEEVISRIKAEVSDADLTPWYVCAARQGNDTISGLVDFLADSRGAKAA